MDFQLIERREKRRKRAFQVLTYSFLSLWALAVLFPFYWMLLSSVKSYSAYNSEYMPQFFTLNPTIMNYLDAFSAVPLGKYFLNTLILEMVVQVLENLQLIHIQKLELILLSLL